MLRILCFNCYRRSLRKRLYFGKKPRIVMRINYNNNNDTNQDINDMIVLIVRLDFRFLYISQFCGYSNIVYNRDHARIHQNNKLYRFSMIYNTSTIKTKAIIITTANCIFHFFYNGSRILAIQDTLSGIKHQQHRQQQHCYDLILILEGDALNQRKQQWLYLTKCGGGINHVSRHYCREKA